VTNLFQAQNGRCSRRKMTPDRYVLRALSMHSFPSSISAQHTTCSTANRISCTHVHHEFCQVDADRCSSRLERPSAGCGPSLLCTGSIACSPCHAALVSRRPVSWYSLLSHDAPWTTPVWAFGSCSVGSRSPEGAYQAYTVVESLALHRLCSLVGWSGRMDLRGIPRWDLITPTQLIRTTYNLVQV